MAMTVEQFIRTARFGIPIKVRNLTSTPLYLREPGTTRTVEFPADNAADDNWIDLGDWFTADDVLKSHELRSWFKAGMIDGAAGSTPLLPVPPITQGAYPLVLGFAHADLTHLAQQKRVVGGATQAVWLPEGIVEVRVVRVNSNVFLKVFPNATGSTAAASALDFDLRTTDGISPASPFVVPIHGYVTGIAVLDQAAGASGDRCRVMLLCDRQTAYPES